MKTFHFRIGKEYLLILLVYSSMLPFVIAQPLSDSSNSIIIETTTVEATTINASSNEEFDAYAALRGWEGNGSQNNPYIIENQTISDINLSCTNRYCIFRNNQFVNSSFIRLNRVNHALLEFNILISVRPSLITIFNSNETRKSFTIDIDYCTNIFFKNNNFGRNRTEKLFLTIRFSSIICLDNNTFQSLSHMPVLIQSSKDVEIKKNTFLSLVAVSEFFIYNSLWISVSNNKFNYVLGKLRISNSGPWVEILSNSFNNIVLSLSHNYRTKVENNTFMSVYFLSGLFGFYFDSESYLAFGNNTCENISIKAIHNINGDFINNTIKELEIEECLDLDIENNTIHTLTIENCNDLSLKNNEVKDLNNKDAPTLVSMFLALFPYIIITLIVGSLVLWIKRGDIP